MKELIKKLHESKKNIFVIGDMLTGKTENVCKPYLDTIIDNEESFLVLDSKSEYIEEFYDKINEKGYNKIIFNIDDFDNTESFNILEYPYKLYKDGRVDDSINILEKMFMDFYYEPQSSDPFWTNSAVSLVVGLILNLFENAKEEEINMSSVINFLDNVDNMNYREDVLTAYFKLNSKGTLSYKYVYPTVFAPIETKSSIMSVTKLKLRMLSYSEKTQYFLAKTSFKLSDIKDKKTAIIIKTRNSMSYRSHIIPMIINQIYMYLLDSNNDRKFNLILDNFDTVEKMEDLNKMLNDAPNKNIKFIIATKSIEEFENKYSNKYIHMSNQIYTKNSEIESVIDNEKESVKPEKIDKIKETSKGVVYPKLNTESIKIYDFIEKLGINSKDQHNNPKNIEEVINEIDEKLKEFE